MHVIIINCCIRRELLSVRLWLHNLSILGVQIVIGDDGGGGSILEHSAADGPAAIAATQFALDLLFVWALACHVLTHISLSVKYPDSKEGRAYFQEIVLCTCTFTQLTDELEEPC